MRTDLRLNPLKVRLEEAPQRLGSRYGWQMEAVPFCAAGWRVEHGAIKPSAVWEFRLGQYYIQDAASMLPVELFDLTGLCQPRALDLAAAPGGKTTHLVSRLGEGSLVVANDSAAGRLGALGAALNDWGTWNTAVTLMPGEALGTVWHSCFDLALLDAPCSMESGLPDRVGQQARRVSDRERQSLVKRQVRLFESALDAVKTGGQVVYSTCTLAPEEDEGVLDRLLRRYPGRLAVEDVQHLLPISAPGLGEWQGVEFDAAVQNAVRLWTHTFGTAGFFAARLRKLEELPPAAEAAMVVNYPAADWGQLTEAAVCDLATRWQEWYGLDVYQLLQNGGGQLWQRGAELHLFPEGYFQLPGGVRLHALGMTIARQVEGAWLPEHVFAARFAVVFKRGVAQIEHSLVRQWLEGRDLEGGYCIEGDAPRLAVFDAWGRFVGLGKRMSGRLKNLLPRYLAGSYPLPLDFSNS